VTFPVPFAQLAPLGACLTAAVVWDIKSRRIPNTVSGLVAVMGLAAQLWSGGAPEALSGIAAGVIVVAALFGFWNKGGIGGGDVKLAGAVAIWMGLHCLPIYMLATALAGGATSAVCWLRSQRSVRDEIRVNLTLTVLQGSVPSLAPAAAGRISVPYGVAIVAGAAFVFWRGSVFF
jgi:Flp pilus assembly protein protease CpaA